MKTLRSLVPGGLRRRVVLLVGVSALVLLAVLWLFSSMAVKESIDRTLQERLAMAQVSADHLEYNLTQALSRFQDIAFYPGLDLEDSNWEPERKALHDAFLQSLPLFSEGLFIVDAQGQVVWTEPSSPSLMNASFLGDRAVRQAVESGTPGVSDLYYLPGSGKAVIIAVSPLRDRGGKVAGAAGGMIDPTRTGLISILLPGRWSDVGYATELLDAQLPQPVAWRDIGYDVEVVDSQGMVLASTRPADVLAFSDHGQIMAELIQSKKEAVSRCHSCHEVGEKKQTEVMAFAPLSSLLIPWGIRVLEPEAEALAPAKRLQQRFLLFGALVMGMTVALGWGMAHGIVGPVVALTRQARRIAGRDLSQPVQPQGSGEVAELGQAFEGMRQNLAESQERDLRWSQELEERVRERTRDLETARRLQEELLHKLITAQEEERKRIARELHDDTSQALTALAMQVDMLAQAPQPGPQSLLEGMKGLVLKTLEGVHRMIFYLRPSTLDDLGLLPAMRWYAESRLEPLGVKLQFTTAGQERRLSPAMETALFRVVQEAVNNIARHAQAENVMIAVEFNNGTLSVEVEDDGVGFDMKALDGSSDSVRGLGLSGIKERVSLLGGTFSLWSEPDSGTRLLVNVPLHQEGTDGLQD